MAERLNINIKENNLKLISAIKSAKIIQEKYVKALELCYTDETLNKIIEINKAIKNAEELVGCTAEEGAKIYAKRFPSNVNKDESINQKGLKRLILLNKKWDF